MDCSSLEHGSSEGSENGHWHSKDHAGGDAYTEGNSKEPYRTWSETRVGAYKGGLCFRKEDGGMRQQLYPN